MTGVNHRDNPNSVTAASWHGAIQNQALMETGGEGQAWYPEANHLVLHQGALNAKISVKTEDG